MSARLRPEHRKRLIVDAATTLAVADGLYEYTLEDVGALVDCSHGLILHHFTSAIGLRDAVIEDAIERSDNSILAQAIIKRDPKVDHLSRKKRTEVLVAWESGA